MKVDVCIVVSTKVGVGTKRTEARVKGSLNPEPCGRKINRATFVLLLNWVLG
jgi:hypothetical protein